MLTKVSSLLAPNYGAASNETSVNNDDVSSSVKDGLAEHLLDSHLKEHGNERQDERGEGDHIG